MILSANENNAFFTLKMLFESKKVCITSTTLKSKLLQEPTFPSLLSLSNVLTDFRIYNVPIAIKPEQLTKIPLPTIAYCDNGIGYVTINKVENNQVELYHDQLGIVKESIADFTQKWQGLILIVKPNGNTKEDNFEANFTFEKVQKFRMPFIYGSFALILGYFILYSSNNFTQSYIDSFYVISLIKIVGLMFSMILISFSIYGDKSIVDGDSALTSIKNNLIKSLILENRRIFGWLNWSEIGLIYFIVGLFSLFLIRGNDGLVILKCFNLITIPYTLWAIHYQITVIRKWCLICTGSMILLWSEFYGLVNIPLLLHRNDSSPINITLINLLLVTVGWVFIKKHLVSSINNEELYYSLQRTKFSNEYVKSLFNNNQSLIPFFKEMQAVLVGNVDAEHSLLAVLNPNSHLCAIKFNELVLLSTSNTKINCKIILVPDSPNDLLGIKIISNILNLPGEERLLALSNWFKQPNFKKWNFSNIKAGGDRLSVSVNENINWAFLSRISLTIPTIFFNNNILPSIYTTKEIPTLLRILNSKQ